MRLNNLFSGINILGNEFKILQYADDTVFFTNGSRNSIPAILDILSCFHLASGLKINLNKSVLFPLGPFTFNQPAYVSDFNIKCALGPVKILGICFTNDGNDLFLKT